MIVDECWENGDLEVVTCCHPERDLLAVRMTSAKQLTVI